MAKKLLRIRLMLGKNAKGHLKRSPLVRSKLSLVLPLDSNGHP
jgi:hypothetical protein